MNPKQFKLGKLPAVKNSVSFRLRDYLALSDIPEAPITAGHLNLVTEHNMFGNDQYGDCVCAGAGHETLLWNKEAKKNVLITTQNVLAMYSDITGFTPNDPSTDNGTSVPVAAKWRQDTGLIDVSGKRHKVVAYVSITPGNPEELKQSIYLFGVCGIGWELPQSALSQAQKGEPWTVISRSPIVGGHYTAAIGYDKNWIFIITWGEIVKVAWDFFSKYCDEAICYFTQEDMINGKTLEGFDTEQLEKDLKAL
jgi:hypothetical protein